MLLMLPSPTQLDYEQHVLGPWEIPKVVHRTWKEDDEVAATFEESWSANNPGWRLVLHTDAGAERYVRRNLPQYTAAYVGLPTPVERADFFRYLVLLHEGGVYADIDVECVRPLLAYVPLGPGSGLVAGWEWGSVPAGWCAQPDDFQYARTSQLAQWVIASAPGHPALRALCDRIAHTYNATLAAHPNRNVLERTGPAAFTDVVLGYALLREGDSQPSGGGSSGGGGAAAGGGSGGGAAGGGGVGVAGGSSSSGMDGASSLLEEEAAPVWFLPQGRWGIDASPDLQLRGVRHFLMGTWKSGSGVTSKVPFGECKPVGDALPITVAAGGAASAAAAAATSSSSILGGSSSSSSSSSSNIGNTGRGYRPLASATLLVAPRGPGSHAPFSDCGRDAAADLLYWGVSQPGLQPWLAPPVVDAVAAALAAAAAAKALPGNGSGSSSGGRGGGSSSSSSSGSGENGGDDGGGGGSGGAVLLDVGAGYGLYSLAAAALGHRVSAFELADSTAAKYLARSAKFNGFGSQRLRVVGVHPPASLVGLDASGTSNPLPQPDVVRVNGNAWELQLVLGCLGLGQHPQAHPQQQHRLLGGVVGGVVGGGGGGGHRHGSHGHGGHGLGAAAAAAVAGPGSRCPWQRLERPPLALFLVLTPASLGGNGGGNSNNKGSIEEALGWARLAGYSRALVAHDGCCRRGATSWLLAPGSGGGESGNSAGAAAVGGGQAGGMGSRDRARDRQRQQQGGPTALHWCDVTDAEVDELASGAGGSKTGSSSRGGGAAGAAAVAAGEDGIVNLLLALPKLGHVLERDAAC